MISKFAAATIIGVLLYLMLGPAPAVEGSAPGIDKLAHLLAFGTIAACVATLIPRTRALIVCGITLLLGAVVEVIQGLIGRDASWLDFIFDGAGVAIFGLAVVIWRRGGLRSQLQRWAHR
ncbi:MAG: VanZ family protein [Actinomycetota bacterium]|nr:VanZ family protein [Actinomycetota bacterium]